MIASQTKGNNKKKVICFYKADRVINVHLPWMPQPLTFFGKKATVAVNEAIGKGKHSISKKLGFERTFHEPTAFHTISCNKSKNEEKTHKSR